MAETKRTEFEAERDREEISRMYLHGVNQRSIADHLNKTYYPDNPITQQQISYDIRLLIDRWVKASINHVDQKKSIELAKLDHLENTYWDAWERSLKNAETTIEETSPKGSRFVTKTEGQSGNPAFLEGVLKCINKRCELLGLDAPKSVDHSGTISTLEMTMAEWKAEQAKSREQVAEVLATFEDGEEPDA